MSDNKDKIESFFKLREGKQSTNLGLKELFSILEQLENLKEIKAPIVDITKQTPARLEFIKALTDVIGIDVKGASVYDKLVNFNQKVENLKSKNQKLNNFNEALTIIFFVRSLLEMIKDFKTSGGPAGARVSGYLFEDFIAILLGGDKIIDEIYDVKVDNEYWSLKLLSPKSEYHIRGSKEKMKSFFDSKDNNGIISYLVCFKQADDLLTFNYFNLNKELYEQLTLNPEINISKDENQFEFDKIKTFEKVNTKTIMTLQLSQKDVDSIVDKNKNMFNQQVMFLLNNLDDLKEKTNKYFISNDQSDGIQALNLSTDITNNLRQIIEPNKQ